MFWRKLRKGDLIRCLRIHPELPAGMSEGAALRALRMLVDSPSFAGVVIRPTDSAGRTAILGSAASVFVSEAFALSEVERPRPGLAARVLLAQLAGQTVVLSRKEIAQANGTAGLNAVTLWAKWRPDISSRQLVDSIVLEFATSYATLHAGYSFRRVLFEIYDDRDLALLRSTGVGRILNFDQTHCHTTYGLSVVDPESSRTLAASVVGRNFNQRRPVLSLTSADQDLLLAALDGDLHDADLAIRLKISLPAVKRRWSALYSRVEASDPSFFHDEQTNAIPERKQGGRGFEKRRRLLHHLRDHPEELRPFSSQTR